MRLLYIFFLLILNKILQYLKKIIQGMDDVTPRMVKMGWFFKKKAIDINDFPIGLEEFQKWTVEVIGLTRLPLNESMKFAVATIVLENKDLLSRYEAAHRVVKACQNQLAAFVFQDIKSRRMAEDEAAKVAAMPAPVAEAPVVNPTLKAAFPSETNQPPVPETPSAVVSET